MRFEKQQYRARDFGSSTSVVGQISPTTDDRSRCRPTPARQSRRRGRRPARHQAPESCCPLCDTIANGAARRHGPVPAPRSSAVQTMAFRRMLTAPRLDAAACGGRSIRRSIPDCSPCLPSPATPRWLRPSRPDCRPAWPWRCCARCGRPSLAFHRRLVQQQLGRLELQRHVGELPLDALELAQRPAELLADQHMLARQVVAKPAQRQRARRIAQALDIEARDLLLEAARPSSRLSAGCGSCPCTSGTTARRS